MEYVSNTNRVNKLKNISMILTFLFPLLLFIFIYPQDWFGITIILGTTFYTLISKELRRSGKLLASVLLILITHHAIAIINAYIAPTLGADGDAIVFHNKASAVAYFGDFSLLTNGSEFYTNFLAMFYSAFGDSYLLGMELSVLAFFTSMIFLVKLLNLIGHTKHQHAVLLMYGLLPTCLMFTSITLRESWQMLFFILVVYSAVKLRKSKKISCFFGLIGSMIGLSFWHNGFLAILPLLMFVTVLWAFNSKKKKSILFNFFGVIIGIILIAISLKVIGSSSTSSASNALTSGNALEYVEQYRSNSKLDAGASYVSEVSFSGPLGIILNMPLMFTGYMFAPFPWHVRGIMDIYALMESFFRFLLLVCAFKVWRKSKGEEKSIYGFLLFIFILMELIWSLGTSNWGTAMRHHLVAYGVLLSIGGVRFSASIKRIMVAIFK